MNAEEYKQIEIAFIAKYAHHWIATEFQEDLKEVSIAYHQAKSKEEAEERYRKALSYYDKETYMNGKSTVAVVNAIRLASGKEDDG